MSVSVISSTLPFYMLSTSSQSNTVKTDLYGQVVVANTNILSSPIQATAQPGSIFLIYVISTTPCNLTCFHSVIATNQVVTEIFPLKGQNRSDFFNTLSTFSETINFQTDANTTLRLHINEIRPPPVAQSA